MSNNWNPNQYERFKKQRSQPFFDLLQMIERRPIQAALDLGCGTGELTRILFDYIQPQHLLAIDSSPEMLARSSLYRKGGLSFELSDIAEFSPEQRYQLVFSNAALQWLPNHEELFPKILSWVSTDGQVAIQVPMNYDHPSHRLAVETAAEMFPQKFPLTPPSVLPVERYAEMLNQAGFERQVARVEVYGHPMASPEEVVEWTKGTLLTTYSTQLNKNDFEEYLAVYRAKILKVAGAGSYFYTFKRILLWGSR